MKRKILCYTLIVCLIICVSMPQKVYAADWGAAIAGGAASAAGAAGPVLILAGLLLGVAIGGDYISEHSAEIDVAINNAVNAASVGIDHAAEKAQEFWDRASAGIVDTTSYVWGAICDVVQDIRDVIQDYSADAGSLNLFSVSTETLLNLYGDIYMVVTSNVSNRVYVSFYQDSVNDCYWLYLRVLGDTDVSPYPWVSAYVGTLGDRFCGLGSYNSYTSTSRLRVDGTEIGVFLSHSFSLDKDQINPIIPCYDSFDDDLSAFNIAYSGLATDLPDVPGQTYGNIDDIIDAYPDAGVGVIGRDGVISIPDVTTVLGVQALEDAVAAVIANSLDYPMVIEAADAIPYVYPLDGIPLAIDPAAGSVDLAVTDVEVALPSGAGVDLDTDMRVYGLEDIFPFCIPFDLYKLFAVLSAEPEAPNFTWEFHVLGNVYSLDIDLSCFDSVAAIMRNMQILLFCIGLALKTRDLIRG